MKLVTKRWVHVYSRLVTKRERRRRLRGYSNRYLFALS